MHHTCQYLLPHSLPIEVRRCHHGIFALLFYALFILSVLIVFLFFNLRSEKEKSSRSSSFIARLLSPRSKSPPATAGTHINHTTRSNTKSTLASSGGSNHNAAVSAVTTCFDGASSSLSRTSSSSSVNSMVPLQSRDTIATASPQPSSM